MCTIAAAGCTGWEVGEERSQQPNYVALKTAGRKGTLRKWGQSSNEKGAFG